MKKTNAILGYSLFTPLLFCVMGMTNLRDPTQPPGMQAPAAAPSVQSFSLTAIFIHPDYRVAIINGRTVREGDQLGEFKVITIRTNAVELQSPGKDTEVLPLAIRVKQDK